MGVALEIRSCIQCVEDLDHTSNALLNQGDSPKNHTSKGLKYLLGRAV